MKLICCLLVLIAAIAVVAQKGPTDSPLQTMVDTERAFAAMSVEQGIRPSFMAFIADDGILFRPKAVKGKQWMTEHPLPQSDKRPLLTWRPSFADMAASGDMGYTFGPWEFKNDIKDAVPSAFGHFVTIWKKQSDGTWKFAVDLGVSHPQVDDPELPPRVAVSSPPLFQEIKKDLALANFADRERAFSKLSETRGGRWAFMSYADPEVRVFREGKIPVRGKKAAAAVLPAAKNVWTWEPEAWDVSASGDLAYSYGTYKLLDDNGKLTETGNYYRIWKRHNKEFRIVLDLANPVPQK